VAPVAPCKAITRWIELTNLSSAYCRRPVLEPRNAWAYVVKLRRKDQNEGSYSIA